MRVALVCDFFPSGRPEAAPGRLIGGAEWSIAALADLLAPALEQLTVFVTCDPSPPEQDGRIRVRRLAPPLRAASARGRFRPWALANPLFTLVTAARLARLAREERADLLHVQTHFSLPAAVLAARRLGVPVAATLRDLRTLCEPAVCLHTRSEVPGDCGYFKLMRECSGDFLAKSAAAPGWARRLRARAELSWLWADNRLRWRCLRRCDAVVGVSQALLEIYRRRGLLDPRRSRLTVIPTAPPMLPGDGAARRHRMRRRLGLGDDALVVHLGKHSAGKGTPLLRQAWREAGPRARGAKLVLAGEGHPPSNLPGLVVLGSLPHPQALDLILAADLVVSASVTAEARSRTLVEAAAAGRPLLGTRAGGTPEIIRDGVNGVLVERGSAAALAEGLLRALEALPSLSAGAAALQGDAGGASTSGFVRTSHLDLYRALLAARRGEKRAPVAGGTP